MAIVLGLSAFAEADETIIIVRHGEKPASGLGQLSCQGLNRSLALAPLIQSRYGKPKAIYAPNPAVLKRDDGKEYAYVRPLATIEPLAISSGLPVDIEFGMTNVEALADRLLNAQSRLQVVAWEHHFAEALARKLLRKLGADPAQVPRWRDSDFDSIYVVHILDHEGKTFARFSHEWEWLDDLPASCPGISTVHTVVPPHSNR